MLIDTHAHLTMQQFNDLPEVLKRARDSRVNTIINASFDMDSSIGSIDMAEKYGNIFASVGIHPHHADAVDEKTIEELGALCGNKRVVAIGETGLDYFENPVPKDVQKRAFSMHIQLAIEKGLPLILHGRDADDDMLDILKKGSADRGVFHCFSGDADYAKRVLDAGFMLSFTGIITFKNADKAREALKATPLDKIMIETDCPYLAPQIYRGKRNEPSYIRFVAEKMAEIKGLSIEEVEEATSSNAMLFFGLPEA